jgi:hypothetical protein
VSEYRLRLNEAEERIRSLELRLGRAEQASPGSFPLAPGQEDAIRRIRELKAEAQSLRDSLVP